MSVGNRSALSVSQLNAAVKQALGTSFSLTWVTGEISNLADVASGHLYFSLKDRGAQVRCAMFRPQRQYLDFKPANGVQVTVRARVTLYEARGDFQLVVEHMAEVGDGVLQQQFEQLKQRLAAEGLFTKARKKPIPVIPKTIGIITSRSGAAIRDALTILKRRFPACSVIIYPSPVQGAAAQRDLARALRMANHRKECEVLLLLRGGGSLEDLWSFNTESVVRAMAATQIPIITGIGHETDTTLADFVADLRAPTPSGAAEAASPDGQVWMQRFEQVQRHLGRNMEKRLQDLAQKLDWLQRHLQQRHPGHKIALAKPRMSELLQRLRRQLEAQCHHAQSRIIVLEQRLYRHSPHYTISRQRETLEHLHAALEQGMQHQLTRSQSKLAQVAAKLNALSPLSTLDRGYTLVTALESGRLLTHAAQCKPGDHIQLQFSDGQVISTVEEVKSLAQDNNPTLRV